MQSSGIGSCETVSAVHSSSVPAAASALKASNAIQVDPLVSPASTAPEAHGPAPHVRPSPQSLQRDVAPRDFVLARDIASDWQKKNYLFYLGESNSCLGSRGCQRSIAPHIHDSDGQQQGTKGGDLAAHGAHYHSDWYGTMKGQRSTRRAKAERAEAISASGDPLSSCCPPAKAVRNVPDSEPMTVSGVSSKEELDDVDDDYVDDFYKREVEDSHDNSDKGDEQIGADERYNSSSDGTASEGCSEHWDDTDPAVHEALEKASHLPTPCAGYVPSQWLDLKPVWLQVRRYLLKNRPDILALNEDILLNKIQWVLHNVYHSCCVSGDVQDIFLDFLGLSPSDDAFAELEIAVDGDTEGPLRLHECLIVRSAHWMVPKELWTSLLVDLRASAGDVVTLVCFNIDGIKNQAVGVGSLDTPPSAILYFRARLRESLVISAGEDDGMDDGDEESGDQVIESHFMLPCGHMVNGRPSAPYSIKWASVV